MKTGVTASASEVKTGDLYLHYQYTLRDRGREMADDWTREGMEGRRPSCFDFFLDVCENGMIIPCYMSTLLHVAR